MISILSNQKKQFVSVNISDITLPYLVVFVFINIFCNIHSVKTEPLVIT